jgi:hypothetical protein
MAFAGNWIIALFRMESKMFAKFFLILPPAGYNGHNEADDLPVC